MYCFNFSRTVLKFGFILKHYSVMNNSEKLILHCDNKIYNMLVTLDNKLLNKNSSEFKFLSSKSSVLYNKIN